MQKKIFIQKSAKKGSRSTTRMLLWAAVALIILVVLIPLVTRQKNGKEASKRSNSEKPGVLVREIPRTPEPYDSAAQPGGTVGNPPRDTSTNVIASLGSRSPSGTPEGEGVSGPPATADPMHNNPITPPGMGSPPSAAGGAQHPLPPPGLIMKEGQAALTLHEEAAQDNALLASKPPEAPLPPSPAEAKPKTEVPATPGAKPAKRSTVEGASTAPQPSPAGRTLFSVQVGSFKERQNAEEMQQSLQKKGYGVMLRSYTHPKLGQLYVVQLEPVDNVGKANTLVEQIKHEEKVRPIIVRVSAGP